MTLQTDEQAASLRPADICTPMYCEMNACAPSMSLCACDWRPTPPRKEEMRPVRPPSCDSTELSVPSAALPMLAICVAQVPVERVEDATGAEVDVLVGALAVLDGKFEMSCTVSAFTQPHERTEVARMQPFEAVAEMRLMTDEKAASFRLALIWAAAKLEMKA